MAWAIDTTPLCTGDLCLIYPASSPAVGTTAGVPAVGRTMPPTVITRGRGAGGRPTDAASGLTIVGPGWVRPGRRGYWAGDWVVTSPVTVNALRPTPGPDSPGLHSVKYDPGWTVAVRVRDVPGAMCSTSPTTRRPSSARR